MEIKDIYSILNKYFKDKLDGFFVIHKHIKSNESFKALKEYIVEIWFIKNSNGDKTKVFTVQICERVLSGQEEVINNRIINQLLLEIFKFIDNKEYLKL